MAHLWVRAEQRPNEARVAVMPQGAAALISDGHRVTVEDSAQRAVAAAAYRKAGAEIAAAGAWRSAPRDAVIVGLKELPDDGSALVHRHVMFGHAYKGQPGAATLLRRFAAGGGTLLDLEYLTDDRGRRVAAFGHWAGYAGAAVALMAWAAQNGSVPVGPLRRHEGASDLLAEVLDRLDRAGPSRPTALIVGSRGRTGGGAAQLLEAAGIAPTLWDVEETAHGGPFPEILSHDILLNCILAGPRTPPFVTADATAARRRLTVIGDIACDPGSAVSAIRVYDRATTWEAPALRVADDPPLDVVAIDNLPAMLPLESSTDFAAQLLPHLRALPDGDAWRRAEAEFRRQLTTERA